MEIEFAVVTIVLLAALAFIVGFVRGRRIRRRREEEAEAAARPLPTTPWAEALHLQQLASGDFSRAYMTPPLARPESPPRRVRVVESDPEPIPSAPVTTWIDWSPTPDPAPSFDAPSFSSSDASPSFDSSPSSDSSSSDGFSGGGGGDSGGGGAGGDY